MKKKTLAILLSAVAVIAIAAGIFVYYRSASAVPVPRFPSFGYEGAEMSFDPSFEFSIETEAVLYAVEPGEPEELTSKVEELLEIDSLEPYLSSEGENENHYLLEDRGLSVSVNNSNGYWDIMDEDATSQPLVVDYQDREREARAEEIARKYIEENGILPEGFGGRAFSYSIPDDESVSVEVTFYPEIDGREVLEAEVLYRVTAIVDENGEVKNISKEASPLEPVRTVALKSEEEVMEEVLSHPEKTLVLWGNGVPLVNCELKYFITEAENGKTYAFPVYELCSAGEGYYRLTVLVDAIKR